MKTKTLICGELFAFHHRGKAVEAGRDGGHLPQAPIRQVFAPIEGQLQAFGA
jgi:hypothetical protein